MQMASVLVEGIPTLTLSLSKGGGGQDCGPVLRQAQDGGKMQQAQY